jgi:hypothetical protein
MSKVFLIDDETGKILLKDGSFVRTVKESEIKFFKGKGWAKNAARKNDLSNYTIRWVYENERVLSDGTVIKPIKLTGGISHYIDDRFND